MHVKQTIVINELGRLSVTQLYCTNTPKRIEVLLEVESPGDRRNIALDGNPDFPHRFDASKLLWLLVIYIRLIEAQ